MSLKNKRFIAREEYFGFTFYDRRTLKHEFVIKKEWPDFLNKKKITFDDYIYLPAVEAIFSLFLLNTLFHPRTDFDNRQLIG